MRNRWYVGYFHGEDIVEFIHLVYLCNIAAKITHNTSDNGLERAPPTCSLDELQTPTIYRSSTAYADL